MKNFNRLVLVTLTAFGLMSLTGCSKGYDYPDEVPQEYGRLWIDPVTQQELHRGRASLAEELRGTLTELSEAICQEDLGHGDLGHGDLGRGDWDQEVRLLPDKTALVEEETSEFVDEDTPEAPLEVSAMELDLEAGMQTLLEVIEAGIDEAPSSPLAILCHKPAPNTDCFDKAVLVAMNIVEEELHELPPSLQVQVLDAYHEDLRVALELVAHSSAVNEGMRSYSDACERGETPLRNALQNDILPSFREQWGWKGERHRIPLAYEATFDDFFFETCSTAHGLNRKVILGMTQSFAMCE